MSWALIAILVVPVAGVELITSAELRGHLTPRGHLARTRKWPPLVLSVRLSANLASAGS